MLTKSSSVWIALLLAAIVAPTFIAAQNDPGDKSTPSADSASDQPHPDAAEPRGRLPNHFGKIGISDEQRVRIYSIQSNYDGRIDELLAQIEELVADRDAEIDAVLTEGQRARLRELRAEARERRSSSSDGDSQPSPDQ